VRHIAACRRYAAGGPQTLLEVSSIVRESGAALCGLGSLEVHWAVAPGDLRVL
jgi:hypothetical protein